MFLRGGWDETSQYWKFSRKNFFIHVKVLSRVFRGKFLALLKKAKQDDQLIFAGVIAPLRQTGNYKQLLDQLYNKEWVVFSEKSQKGHSRITEYLARYSYRVAISNERIIGVADDSVHFRYKDYADKGKRKVMALDAEEFIRRFLLHVLPESFCKIRYYGIFASCKRKTELKKIRKAIDRKGQKAKYVGLLWHEILFLLTGKDPMKCPHCKAGKMIPLADTVIKSNKAPPK